VGRWAAQARFHAFDPHGWWKLGEMSARQAEALAQAIDFILKLRLALQLTAGRRQDQLRFDLQERIAPIFHPDGGLSTTPKTGRRHARGRGLDA
jgi:UTP:GlnB (protein PII) uridylyltransferase